MNLISVGNIQRGDLIKAVLKDDEEVIVQGHVDDAESELEYISCKEIDRLLWGVDWNFELVKTAVELPEGENALVAHKKHPKTAATYLHKTGTWYITTGDMSRRCSYSEVYDAIREEGYEVIYEGIEQ